MSHPYSSMLLNEIHTYFPDFLYRRERFRTVADALAYLVEGANQNPYVRERDRYLQEEKKEEPIPILISRAPRINRVSVLPSRSFEEEAAELLYREMYGSASAHSSSNNLSNLLLSGGFLDGIRTGLGSFMEPVIVHPTPEQIGASSSLFRGREEDVRMICPICQDSIESDHMVRMLTFCTHRFHKECIDTWFQSHVTCPTCSHDIRESA